MELLVSRVGVSVQGGAFVSYEPIEWTSFEASEFELPDPESFPFLEGAADQATEGRPAEVKPTRIAALFSTFEESRSDREPPRTEELW